MHPSVKDFVRDNLAAEEVAGRRVLEVGSGDINGSVREDVEDLCPREYLGADASPGPGVDLVVDCENLYAGVGGQWDVVISTEMLEHVRDWQSCLENLIDAVVPGGVLIVTTRSPGFPYHPFPEDHWRFPEGSLDAALSAAGLAVEVSEADWQCPGVLIKTRKPEPWDWPPGWRLAWRNITVSNEAR